MLHPRHMTMLRLSLLSLAVIAFDAYAQNGNDAQHGFVPHEADQHALGPLGSSDIGPVPDFIPVPGEGFPEKPGPAVLAPTAFTPDGDGLNDKYFPHVIGMELGLSRFRVFDRWGRELFTTQGRDGWDGTISGGAMMPQGVYVWHLEAWPLGASDKLELAGSVTLIR